MLQQLFHPLYSRVIILKVKGFKLFFDRC